MDQDESHRRESALDRRSFLSVLGLSVGGLTLVGTPVQAASPRASEVHASNCDCGCDGAIAATPLPTIPKTDTSVSRFSRSGKTGVGFTKAAGAGAAPVLWKTVAGKPKITQLDPLDSRNPALALGVNDLGNSIGYTGRKPVLWNADGSARPLPMAGAALGWATAISNSGHCVGRLGTKGTGEGCLWSGNTVTRLTAPGAKQSVARGVNAGGVVCGAVQTDAWYPVVWYSATPTFLPVPRAYRGGTALFITDDGIVIGEVNRRRSGRSRAAMWIDGRCVLVGPRTGFSTGVGVSDQGQVIGTFMGRDGRRGSFVAGESEWRELRGSDTFAEARSISSTGSVFGNSSLAGVTIPVTWASPALS